MRKPVVRFDEQLISIYPPGHVERGHERRTALQGPGLLSQTALRMMTKERPRD
jgi:hypothetical protein